MRRKIVLWIALAIVLSLVTCMPVLAETAQDFCGLAGEVSLVEGDLNDPALWEKGGISAAGIEYIASDVVRTKSFLSEEIALVYGENDYAFRVAVYDSAEKFLGFWDNKGISDTSKLLYYLNPQGLNGYRIRLVCQRLGANSIGKDECKNIHFLDSEDRATRFPQPTLTFIDDDGSYEALSNWEDICDEAGIKITAALVTNAIGDENDPNRAKASWSDIARLQEKGFEFVSHTHNHINVLKTSNAKCEEDFAASIALLREHGCEYRYLVYPYNATSSQKIALVKKYFDAAVGLGGNDANPGSDNTLPVYTHWLRRYSINEANATTEVEYDGAIVNAHAFKNLDTLKGYIDDAITNNSWVIIMTHLRNDGAFYHDEESRQMILELCEYAREKSVAIQTFGEAYSRFKNVVETGTQSIYGNPYYVVDCNGVVHYRGANENGHIPETIPGVEPNCVQTGLTEGSKCAACGEILVTQGVIPLSGAHVYDNENDAVCNVCGDVRKMVESFDFVDYGVILEDEEPTHKNHRVVVYKLGDQNVKDPSDETILKEIDSNAITYWGSKSISKILLTDAGRYVVLLKYNVSSGAVVKVPMVVTVSTAPKLFVDENRITVIDDHLENINHRLSVYYLGDQTPEDICDEGALKEADPDAVTYWGVGRINKLILTKPGNYALLLHYNEGKSAKKTVAVFVQAAALTEPVVEGLSAAYKLIVTDEDATHINHRATLYYTGDQTVEDLADESALKRMDPSAKTYWGLDRINKAQLRKKGNYAVVLHYNLRNGIKRTVARNLTVDLEMPVLSMRERKLVVEDTKGQYINHRATVYYLENKEIADVYDETALMGMDAAAKTYWGLSKINRVELNRPGNYVVLLHYNLPGSSKMTVAVRLKI